MTEYPIANKIFVKSSNTSYKILFRYSLSLIVFLLYVSFCLLIKKDYSNGIKLFETFIISSIISIIFQCIINITRKKKGIIKIFTEDNVLASSVIISLFSYKEKFIVIIIASLISEIVKLFSKNIGLSSSLYGVLFILIYKRITGNIIELPFIRNIFSQSKDIIKLSLGLTFQNLSPVVSISLLLYLFQKKSIKYPIVFSYIISYIITVTIFSILNSNGLNYFIINILGSNVLFIAVFLSGDYKITPISIEGGIIYGIILSTLTFILSHIDLYLAPVISCILSSLFLTRFIDKISFKLKYNRKFYKIMTLSSIGISLLGIIIISIIK